MRKRYYFVGTVLAFLLVPHLANAQTFFTARLSAAQETHEVTSDASGTAALALTAEGVRFFVTVDGLSGDIAAAHFHNAAAGVDGPVVRTISDDFTGNTASGLWTASDAQPLTDSLIQDLLAGNLYLNVHTVDNAPGEIRGQVYPNSGAGLTVALTAAQQTHEVDSDASGTASVQATDAGVLFFVTVDGLSGDIAAAHFHNAAAGVDGPVVRTISDDFDGNTAFGLWTATDAQPLTDSLFQDLLTGNLYLNVHTPDNGPGEIRGQVVLSGGWGFSSMLDAEQETHAVISDAMGTAAMTLTDAGLVFKVTVEGLSGDIAAAHFHNAVAGVDGSVVRTISDDFTGNSASGLWTASDAEPLTDELIQDLLAGNLYLNVHTAANMPGEIRGQVLIDPGTNLTAQLTPAQENADVDSDGSGTAALILTDAGLAFRVSVDGLTGPIVAAHFHKAATGDSGDVVRGIGDDFADAGTQVTLMPSKDNTLYESNTGEFSNGSGTRFFAGRTNQGQNSIRRGLVAFDVAGALPAGVVVESVELTLNMTQSQAGAETIALHRVEADWGEGASAAGRGQGGGAQAATDDATWIHTFFNTSTWTTPGGDFAAGPSASAEVVGVGTYTWASTPEMVADVQAWLDDPTGNFGWLLRGNESASQSSKAFDSREGANPPLLTITYAGSSGTAMGLWTASDAEPLTDELIQDLLAGNLYFNIHTAANPPGEIRGQVHVSAGSDLSASLTAAQETHEVDSDAAGTAAMTLTDAGLAFRVTVEGLSGGLAAAHFHNAAAGVDGPVVRTISDDFEGNTASGLWTANDAQPLTDSLIQDLLTGNLYLNVHTPDNGPGEIRGQVRLSGGIGAAVQLDPGQETHAVTSDARGTSTLTLTEAGLVFDLTAEGLSGDIAAAHFHNGPFGADGVVVRTISDDFTGNTASGVWREGDGEPFTVALTNELLAGNLYLNVHTPDNMPGEIRGQVRPNGVVATAIEHLDDQVPEAFTLSQNFPNPFNPATTIAFSLTQSTHAVLTVYNVLGQKVATLVDGNLLVGQYRITFDAGGLSTGVYYYRLEADGQVRTQKMILLK